MNPKSTLKPQDVVVLYTIQHLSCSQIAKIAGLSRQAIWKVLRFSGTNTSRGPGGGTRVMIECEFCGTKKEWTRSRWRHTNHHYCSPECYYAAIENPGYHPWRQGQRLAKAIVSQYFTLQEGNVIHHKDGDSRNNDRSNLAVYQSQSAHMKHHRGSNTKPIWDGFNLCHFVQ